MLDFVSVLVLSLAHEDVHVSMRACMSLARRWPQFVMRAQYRCQSVCLVQIVGPIVRRYRLRWFIGALLLNNGLFRLGAVCQCLGSSTVHTSAVCLYPRGLSDYSFLYSTVESENWAPIQSSHSVRLRFIGKYGEIYTTISRVFVRCW